MRDKPIRDALIRGVGALGLHAVKRTRRADVADLIAKLRPLYSGVELVRLPVMWNPTNEIHARMFYTADALGKLDEMHETIFKEMHMNRKTLTSEADIEALFAEFDVSSEDFKKTGAVPADTEDLVNECLRIAGTEAAFVGIQQNNSALKVSFRSRSTLNVAKVAEQFGGGGHKQASGAVVRGPMANALQSILDAMKEGLDA